MIISFHGAAGEVTGSCILLEVENKKILIDCGLFQGSHTSPYFKFKPKEIDYLLLTHAHLDHCGRIPLLVKQGFRGKIITTGASKDLAKLVLLDSAHINEEENERRIKYEKRRGKNKNTKGKKRLLYNTIDVLNSMDYFGTVAKYEKPIELFKNFHVTFFDAGHILGSASLFLEIQEGNNIKKLVISGDLGNNEKPIIKDPSGLPNADYILMETTYGDRSHKTFEESKKEFYQALNETFKRGGNVYIPTFALERAQEILFIIREGLEKKILPSYMQVFLDSPMALSATEIYKRHPECFDEEMKRLFSKKIDPLHFDSLHYSRSSQDSMNINNVKSGAVILAGSGMCTGGRICHHLKHNLFREECSVVFVSFAQEGTLARKIIDGEKIVRIFNENILVRSKIYTINGFSAHAGQDELLAWHRQFKNIKSTFLYHGNQEARLSMKDILSRKNKIETPKLYQSYRI